MEYRIINKKRPPKALFNLTLNEDQKTFLDPLNVILKEYQNQREWTVLSIHLEDDKKTTIGFAVIGYFNPKDVWIDDIMIDSKYQNQGYGTQAMNYLIDYLYQRFDCDLIYLSCFKENEKALKLYQKLGFHLTDEKDINGEIILVYYR